jgi:hypothetical protein
MASNTIRVASSVFGPIIGIDVGEDFLDLAILDAVTKSLRLARVAVAGVDRGGAIAELRRRMIAVAPELGAAGALVLIDSPCSPRDFELAIPVKDVDVPRDSAGTLNSRAIDTTLRGIVNELGLQRHDGTRFRLALFPTPKVEFFAACANDPSCKSHLAAIARELFGTALDRVPALASPTGGRVFTRFMLTGFAVFRALESLRADCFEAYPDLAFRLWACGEEILPKSAGRLALEVRRRIISRLAGEVGCEGIPNISTMYTLDEADAAVLALSAGLAARTGTIALIEHPGEGRFALALDRDQARRLTIRRPDPG